MNKVKEIQALYLSKLSPKNDKELKLNLSSASWHDQYKHSAYVYIGGLVTGLTEGDVITILSQYGEVADINMPRDKETGKPRGFAFVMYEDQRSTVLAVDNLNGSQVLGRTLRVDHVDRYSQPKVRNDEGELVDAESEQLNARWMDHAGVQDVDDAQAGKGDKREVAANDHDSDDGEDPMAAYIREQQRKKAGGAAAVSSEKHDDKEERKARKAERAAKRALKEARARRQDSRRSPEHDSSKRRRY
ncbi:hypothetical protein E3P99_01668 [Wallemia hederae]|uniref:RRM domain-containing protein n=1 Tax=Wallemia hederae TaxID=1540922 RepID=A0A4T0FTB3_9BASI|nr:hypothetical protein E3P99_01668 [Wallemia hederae]